MVAGNRNEGGVRREMALLNKLGQPLASRTSVRYAAVGDVVGRRKRERVEHIARHEASVVSLAQPLDSDRALLLNDLLCESEESSIVVHPPVDQEGKLSWLLPIID